VVTSGPRLGDLEAAGVAAALGAQASVVSGGLLCLAGIIAVVHRFPELAAHVSRTARSGGPEAPAAAS